MASVFKRDVRDVRRSGSFAASTPTGECRLANVKNPRRDKKDKITTINLGRHGLTLRPRATAYQTSAVPPRDALSARRTSSARLPATRSPWAPPHLMNRPRTLLRMTPVVETSTSTPEPLSSSSFDWNREEPKGIALFQIQRFDAHFVPSRTGQPPWVAMLSRVPSGCCE